MKKTLLIIGAGIAAAAYFAKSKIDSILNVADSFETKLKRIQKVSYKSGNLFLTVSITITNNSDIDFHVTGAGVVSVTQIKIFDLQGRLLAISKSNIPNLQIPAHQQITIENIEIEAGLLGGIAEYFNTGFESTYLIETTLNALGKEFTINQEYQN